MNENLVSVVLKSSDFENARYLDLRHVFQAAVGTTVTYVETTDSVAFLRALESSRLIVISSGALSDAAFSETLSLEKHQVKRFLDSGNSLLILSQLLLATNQVELDFLPQELGFLSLKRPSGEDTYQGTLVAPGVSQAFWIPNSISATKLADACTKSELGGLYFHYWKPLFPENWTQLLIAESEGEDRPLLIQHENASTGSQIILSSLALDRIGAADFLKNLIELCLYGHKTVAIIAASSHDTDALHIQNLMSFEGVQAQQFQMTDSTAHHVIQTLKSGIHPTVILSHHLEARHRHEIEVELAESISSGKVLLGTFRDEGEWSLVALNGKDDSTLYRSAMANFERELSKGLYSQSLFDTLRMALVHVEGTVPKGQLASSPALVQALLKRVGANSVFSGSVVAVAAFVSLVDLMSITEDEPRLRASRNASAHWLEKNFEGLSPSDSVRSLSLLSRSNSLSGKIKSLALNVAQLPNSEFSDVADLLNLAFLRHHLNLEIDANLLTSITSRESEEYWDAGAMRADLVLLLLKLASKSEGNPTAGSDLTSFIARQAERLVASDIHRQLQQNFAVGYRNLAAYMTYRGQISAGAVYVEQFAQLRQKQALATRQIDNFQSFASDIRRSHNEILTELLSERASRKRLTGERFFARLAILGLSLTAFLSTSLLFFSQQRLKFDLSVDLEELFSNWGLITAIAGTALSLGAWALKSYQARKSEPSDK